MKPLVMDVGTVIGDYYKRIRLKFSIRDGGC